MEMSTNHRLTSINFDQHAMLTVIEKGGQNEIRVGLVDVANRRNLNVWGKGAFHQL